MFTIKELFNDYDMSEKKLTTLEQVRVLADSTRLRIMQALFKQGRPMTVKQVADLLEEEPHRLYHHMTMLEKAGLVKLVDIVVKSGIAEKYYCPAVESLRIDERLLQAQAIPDVEFYQGITAVLDVLSANIRRSIERGLLGTEASLPATLRFSKPLRLTREQAQVLNQKVGEFYEQLRKQGSRDGEFEYQLGVIFYPMDRVENP